MSKLLLCKVDEMNIDLYKKKKKINDIKKRKA